MTTPRDSSTVAPGVATNEDVADKSNTITIGPISKAVSAITAVLTALTAVAALILSLINWRQANADPQIVVYLPKIVRVFAQPRSPVSSPYIGLIIEPTYALLRNSEKTAVISDIALRLTPPDKSIGPSSVAWLQFTGLVINGEPNPGISFVGDPSPIVVGQNSPQSPHLLFAVYGIEQVTPGRWILALETRQAGKVIINNSCIDISPAWAQFVNRSSLGSPIIPIFRNDLGPAAKVIRASLPLLVNGILGATVRFCGAV